jgi:GTPase
MIDFVRITVRAGEGGSGAGSFKSIKGRRRGKADGGDGGDGGDVYLQASADLGTLEPYRYVKDYRALSGQNGLSNLRRGAKGEDLVLKVPTGTVVSVNTGPVATLSVGASKLDKGSEPDETELRVSRNPFSRATSSESDSFFLDLVQVGQKELVAKGGVGGRGNAHLKDEYDRRPLKGETGEEGEFFELTLELKLIADIGLIGLPNAGKSTLLSKLTKAKPEVAAYPFTTLEPNLGVMNVAGSDLRSDPDKALSGSDLGNLLRRVIFADIPGLIEGASGGKGLGDLFLRHIERTGMLLHLIDMSTDDAWRDYQIIRKELKDYARELSKKKELIVLNKSDLVDEAAVDRIKKEFGKRRKKVVVISAEKGDGLEALIKYVLSIM